MTDLQRTRRPCTWLATGACSVALQTRERDVDVWAIGFTYPFSRRTNGYINFSDRDGEKIVNNNITIDRKQYTVGIRHLFWSSLHIYHSGHSQSGLFFARSELSPQS